MKAEEIREAGRNAARKRKTGLSEKEKEGHDFDETEFSASRQAPPSLTRQSDCEWLRVLPFRIGKPGLARSLNRPSAGGAVPEPKSAHV